MNHEVEELVLMAGYITLGVFAILVVSTIVLAMTYALLGAAGVAVLLALFGVSVAVGAGTVMWLDRAEE